MAAEDTIQPQFYSVWPNLGKKFNKQLGEIRTDTAALDPVVRGIGLDAAGDFSSLDGIAANSVQAYEIGKQDWHNKFRTHYNKDTDVFEIAYNTGTSQTPNWYTTWWIDDDGHVTQQNTPTTASNVGGGTGLFKQKVGVDLEFKSLSASTPLTLTDNGSKVNIDGDALVSTYSSDRAAAPSGDANTGIEIILSDTGKLVNDLPFKALKAGPNVVIRNLAGTAIEIESTAQVVEFYGIHVAHDDGSHSYPEVHNFLVNREDFYITQQTTFPSNKTIILNSISDPFNSTDYVAVVGDDMTGQLAMHDASADEPALGFTSDTTMGLYRNAADDLGVAIAGAAHTRFLSDRLFLGFGLQVTQSGDEETPDIYFFPDSDTGLYQDNADELAFATGGKRAGYFTSGQDLVVQNDLLSGRVEAGIGKFYTYVIADSFNATRIGTGARPAYQFQNTEHASGTSSGMYLDSNGLGMSYAGVARMWFKSAVNLSNNPIHMDGGQEGTAEAPAYSFEADVDMGMYRKGSEQLAFSAEGTECMYLELENESDFSRPTINSSSAGGFRAGSAGAQIPSYGFLAETGMGMYRAAELKLGWLVATGQAMTLYTGGHLWTAGSIVATTSVTAGTDVFTTEDAYQADWEDDLSVPTKNAVYDKIESLDLDADFTGTIVRADGFYIGVHDAGMSVDLTGALEFSAGGDGVSIPHDDLEVAGTILTRADAGNPTPISIGPADALTAGISFDGAVTRTVAGGAQQFVVGTSFVNSIARLGIKDGGVGEPGLIFISDVDTGIWRPGADEMAFSTDGTLAGRFDATQNFHLTGTIYGEDAGTLDMGSIRAGAAHFYTSVLIGTGTDAPEAPLHVEFAGDTENSTVFILKGAASVGVNHLDTIFHNTNANSANRQVRLAFRHGSFDSGAGGAGGYIDSGRDNYAGGESGKYDNAAESDSDLRFATALSNTDTERMRITSAGFVGIGTTSPQALLDVRGDAVVRDEIHAGRVEAGIGVFYTSLTVDEYLTVGQADAQNHNSDPQLVFGDSSATGIGYNYIAPALQFHVAAARKMYITSSAIVMAEEMRFQDGTALDPGINWSNDSNTGLFRLSGDASGVIRFSSDSAEVGHWAGDGLHVEDDLMAGRIHSGPATFYTQSAETALTVSGDVHVTRGAVIVDTSAEFAGGQFLGQSDDAVPQFAAEGRLNSGVSVSNTHVKIWEQGDLCCTWNGLDQVMSSNIRLELGGAGDDSLYFNVGIRDPGVHSNLDNGSSGWGWHVSGNEVGYFDWTDEDLHITNNLHIGGVLTDVTADNLTVTDTLSAGRVEAGYGTFYTQVLAEGTQAKPGHSFTLSDDAGMWLKSAGDLRLVTGGVGRISLQAGGLVPLGQTIPNTPGTAAAPSYAWNHSRDTGLYELSSGDDTIAFSTAGTYAGHFDDGQQLYIERDVRAGRVEAGIGTFYTQVNADRFVADRIGTATACAFGFGPDGGDTGMYQNSSGRIDFSVNSTFVLNLTNSRVYAAKPILMRGLNGPAAADIGWLNDADTGLYQIAEGDDGVAFTTGGQYAGHFDADQNLHVENDVKAGHVESGTGTFYTNVHAQQFLASPTGAAEELTRVGYAFEESPDSGLMWNTGGGGYPKFVHNGASQMFFAGYIGVNVRMRSYAGSAANPNFASQSDLGTGMWFTSADPDKVNFATDALNRVTIGNTGMNVEGSLWVDNEISTDVGFFYQSIHIGDPADQFGAGDPNDMWKLYVEKDANQASLRISPTSPQAPSGSLTGTNITLDGPINFLPNRVQAGDGFNPPDAAFSTEPTITSSGQTWNRYSFIRDATIFEDDTLVPKLRLFSCEWKHTNTAEALQNDISVINLGPKFWGATDAVPPSTGTMLNIAPSHLQQDGEGTIINETIAIEVRPVYAGDAAAGATLTQPLLTNYSSTFSIVSGATATTNVGHVNDYMCLAGSYAGTGAFGYPSRTNLTLEAEPVENTSAHIGISSAITASSGNRFINHTGGAVSHHTGDFYIHSELVVDEIKLGNNFITGYTKPFISLLKTVAVQQDIGGATNATVLVTWDVQEHIDSTFTHSTSVNPSRITVNETGRYEIYCSVAGTNTGGARLNVVGGIKIDGGTRDQRGGVKSYSRSSVTGFTVRPAIRTERQIIAGSYIEFETLVETADGTYVANTIDAECEFIMRRLS